MYGCGVTQSYTEALRLARASSVRLRNNDFAPAMLAELEEAIRSECPLLEKRVQITGTSQNDMNGRTGVASAFDQSTGRYVVELEPAGAGKKKKEKLKLKPENLTEVTTKKSGKSRGKFCDLTDSHFS